MNRAREFCSGWNGPPARCGGRLARRPARACAGNGPTSSSVGCAEARRQVAAENGQVGRSTQNSSRLMVHIAACLMLVALLGCEPKKGDKVRGLTQIPATAKVQVGPLSKEWMVDLPEPLRRRFIVMVHSEATFMDFRTMPARPWGVFVVEGESFFWHGNAVVHSEQRRGRGWTSPVMQALINRVWQENPPEGLDFSSATKWKMMLDGLAKSTNLDATPIEIGLGAYPKRSQP